MNKNILIVLVITVGIESVFCYPSDILKPCKKSDEECILSSARHAMKKIYAGIPELNIEPADPLNIGEVQGDLSTLKYTFHDTVYTGYLKCNINNVKLDLDKMSLRVNSTCPDIVIDGHYTAKGQLIILPIEGEGPFHIDIKKYTIDLTADLKLIDGKDEKKHIMIKKYQVHGEPQDGVHYDLQNLFGGSKELSDTVLKFVNENWKEVADFVQAPLLDKTIKKIVSNINKFLKAVPVKDLYLD